MAANQDNLVEILNNPQRIASVLEMAQMLKGRGPQPDAAPPAPLSPPPREAAASKDSAPSLGGISSMMEILPSILGLMGGGENHSLSKEKVDLLNAIKPYAANHSDSIDRALKMAGMAKVAKSALSTFGQKK